VSADDAELAEHPLFRDGVRLYRAAAYWDAHEAWETLWRAETGERRVFLQGMIQIAAAMHKLLVMRDPPSAARILERALEKLAPYPDVYAGVALEPLRCAARACAAAITEARDDAASHVPPLNRAS
jgi:predicted metal-dependent hydrolase